MFQFNRKWWRQWQTLPDPTRFDQWPQEDVYRALETAISETTQLLDRFRNSTGEDAAQAIFLIESRLCLGLEAAASLRRRVVQRL